MKRKHHVHAWVTNLVLLGACVGEPLDGTNTAVAEQEVTEAAASEEGDPLPPCPARTEIGYDLRAPIARRWLKYTMPPAETTEISIRLQLDPELPIATSPFDPDNAEQTAVYSISTPIYDFIGKLHTVTIYFVRTDARSWQWHALTPGEEIALGPVGQMFEGARGALTFDRAGTLVETSTELSRWTFWGTPPDAPITFDFGGVPDGSDELTSLRAPTSLLRVAVDGYPVGSVTGFQINDAGEVMGHFSNGQAPRHIGRCAPDHAPDMPGSLPPVPSGR